MKAFLVILVIAILTALSSCQLFENEPELPPITTEGKGTFGCLVNGNVWTPLSSYSQGGVFVDLQNSANTVGVNIYADNYKDNNGITISIFDDPTLIVGQQYDLTDINFFAQYSWHNDLKVCSYDSILAGSITLSRFDMVSKVISGTFEFKAYSEGCEDSIVITKGRFDLGI